MEGGQLHVNDQIVENPLKKKEKPSTKIVVPRVFVGTTIQVVNARNQACKQTTQGKLKWFKWGT